MYASFFLFFISSVISCHLVRRSCPFFDVAILITFFCLFVVCWFFLLVSSPILDTLSIPVVAVCDIVYVLFKLSLEICPKA